MITRFPVNTDDQFSRTAVICAIFLELFLDERKMDHVLQETERNRQMANQIAYRTFAAKGVDDGGFPTGPKVYLYRVFIVSSVWHINQKLVLTI